MCLNICSFACELLGMAALNRWFGTAEMLLAEWFMCVSVCLLWFSGHKNERSGAGQSLPCSALSPLTFSLSPHALLCMSFHSPYIFFSSKHTLYPSVLAQSQVCSVRWFDYSLTNLNKLLSNISPSNLLCCTAKQINRSSHAISAGLFLSKLNSRLRHVDIEMLTISNLG